MSDSISATCPRCGGALADSAAEGMCPRCLLALNFGPGSIVPGELDGSVPVAEPLSPEKVAPYFPQLEILECLGRGGMGVVYKARQRSLERLVALKLLAPERVLDPRFAEHFSREAKALATLNHPHIVTIHDFGVVDAASFSEFDASRNTPFADSKIFFLLMEFVDGANLRQLLQTQKFTPEEALAIVPPICDALQYAHEHGIVHRDIKPENLLLDKEGRVKIADFGIAKMLGAEGAEAGLAESQPAGTPQYMAPEQKEHRSIDHRADIYSLGVVFYEMLTGELPGKKIESPSRKVQMDVRIDEIVLRALEKTPELRYQTASDFRTQVEAISGVPKGTAPKAVGSKLFDFTGTTEFRSRTALRWAQLACVGCLGFLGYIPGWERLFGLFGFFGFIGIAYAIEAFARSKPSRLAVALAFGSVALGIVGITAVGKMTRPSDLHRDLADFPFELQKLPTTEVIRAGVSKPLTPWAWQELDRRALTSADVRQIFDGLTSWLQREHPTGFSEPLSWLDTFLSQLAKRGLANDEQAIRFIEALQGQVRCEPHVRLREGAQTMNLRAECRSRWARAPLGFAMMNKFRGVTVDGQLITLGHASGRFWNLDDLSERVPLPPLAPGKHKVTLEVLSALLPQGDLTGLAPDAPSADWPPAKKRWTRTAGTELVIYPRNAVMVSQTQDPALDPVAAGALAVKQVIIRSKGDQAQAVLVFDLNGKLPVSISFDVVLRVGDQMKPCGSVSVELRPGTQGSFSGRELSADLSSLSPEIKEADIILTPNPLLLEATPTVDRIWGKEAVFRRVPLTRQDLTKPTAPTSPATQAAG